MRQTNFVKFWIGVRKFFGRTTVAIEMNHLLIPICGIHSDWTT